MGKKSRRPNRKKNAAVQADACDLGPNPTCPCCQNKNQNNKVAPPESAPPQEQAVFYPSDGPSDVELLQTTSQLLQAKLDLLTKLGLGGDRAGFVREFVPLDLPPQDAAAYLQDLTTHPEAEGQWRNLIAEIAAIRSGKGVDRIEGDQVTRAVFCFEHPLLAKCDREVAFCCINGEWRAEG